MRRTTPIAGLIACGLVSLTAHPAQADPPAAEIASRAPLATDRTSLVQQPSPPSDTTHVGKLAAGISLLGLGSLSVLGGGVAYTVLSAQTRSDCGGGSLTCVDEHKTGKSASIVAMVLGGAGLATGIPLIIGSRDSSETGRRGKRVVGGSAVLAPELRVSVGAASLTWSF
ncbi:MAG: hypothetical protein DRI90_22575 [Deltaproteobacteria bacterium]|nr:MAG: hypothetical protein DRI90_22575 [Deltaproteobacteria bacterium]